MIYEMIFDTVKPGRMPAYVKGLTNTALALRDDRRGELVGAWTSDFGAVNQAVLLWGYASLTEYAAATETLTGNAEWAAHQEYVSRSFISARVIELLGGGRPVRRGPITETLHELRTYTVRPGAAQEFVTSMTAILPVREKYHRNFAVWWPYSGNVDRAFHMWLYDDFKHRAFVREQCAKDPDWHRYLERTVPLTERMYSTLLVPIQLSR